MNVISRFINSRWPALFRDNRRLAVALGLFSVMPLLCSAAIGGWLLANRVLVEQLAVEYGRVLVVLSCLTMAAGLTPTTFVALVCGFFIGMEGVVALVLAYVLASGVGYGLGRCLDGGRLQRSLLNYHLAARVAEDIRQRPILILVLVRLSPALPFCLMNLVLAALKVRFPTYLLAGAAGMLPRTLISLWIGSQSRDLVTLIEQGGGQFEAVAIFVGSVITVGLLGAVLTGRVRKYLHS